MRDLSIMPKAADYSAKEPLRDGRTIEIRALRPDDREDMLASIGRTGPQSLRRRFFGPKRGFSETELAFFMNIDFDNHVALVAQIDEDGRPSIVGGGRYIVVQPGRAESPSSWSMHIRGWVSERPSCVIWLAWRATQD